MIDGSTTPVRPISLVPPDDLQRTLTTTGAKSGRPTVFPVVCSVESQRLLV